MNTPPIELCDEAECDELKAFLVERIYEFNAQATGYFDGTLVGGRLRGDSGEVIAAFKVINPVGHQDPWQALIQMKQKPSSVACKEASRR